MSRLLIVLFGFACFLPVSSRAEGFLCSKDPLAQRDEDGLLHQMPSLTPTDLAPRRFRLAYHFTSSSALTSDPAYVGALQMTLRRYGYYCGPIDGVFSEAVSVAIARMQKNYSQKVTGTLTCAVRAALNLP